MTYRVQVDGTFTFTDTATTLTVNGLTLDLRKIETLEEWNTTLYAIACQALGHLITPQKPSPASPESPTEHMANMGAEFQRQQSEISARTQQFQDDVRRQYEDLARIYEGATKATKPASGGT